MLAAILFAIGSVIVWLAVATLDLRKAIESLERTIQRDAAGERYTLPEVGYVDESAR